MGLTRIDCDIFCTDEILRGGSYAVLNPNREPGCLVAGFAQAVREGLGGKVACKLALEHFVEAALDYCGENKNVGASAEKQDRNLGLLEDAFRRANRSVYEFGHRLAAGGRMSASLLGLVVRGDAVAVGRVNHGAVFLVRGGEAFPFYQDNRSPEERDRTRNYVGSNSIVDVELVEVPIEEGDVLVILNGTHEPDFISSLTYQLPDIVVEAEGDPYRVAQRVAACPPIQTLVMAAKIGPRAIYLNEAV
jgi:hypothetical protein